MKELDLRDTGLREVARQTANISGCLARKNTTIKQANKINKSSTRYRLWVLAKKRTRSHTLVGDGRAEARRNGVVKCLSED